ncbi:MAG: NAD-dependent epimerase/dehydratase family protein, partial [Acidimicrobiia bacterium]
MTGVAVVGGGGQVGSALVARLSRDPALRVWAVCRNNLTAAPLRLRGLDVRQGDVTRWRDRKTVLAGAQVIVNCALATGLPTAARLEDERVISALCESEVEHLIHLSSVSVYGSPIAERGGSFARPRPGDAYGQRKLHLDRFVTRRARPLSGVRCTVLRLGHVYGPGQWLSEAILRLAGREGFALPYAGSRPSNAVHVNNVAAGTRALIGGAPAPPVCNLFDPTGSRWRTVFDWNTGAVGLAPVPSLSAERAHSATAIWVGRRSPPSLRMAREAMAWAAKAPESFLRSSPATRELCRQGLSLVGSRQLERRIRLRYYT